MNVYLVPTGRARCDLYCEVRSETDDEDSTSFWGRIKQSFGRAVAEGEEADQPSGTQAAPKGAVRRFITRRLAEAVAEQRLLWNLRRETGACLVHPDDLPADEALTRCRAIITADRDKHWKRSIVNAGLLVVSAPVALVPGPNLLAYYFTFRTVGHFLSKRGANHGLVRVTWSTSPSAALREVREALAMRPVDRARRIEDIASALGLERLPRFVAGVADQTP